MKWLAPFLDRLIEQVSAIDQISTQWNLAKLFLLLETDMSPAQKEPRATP